MKIYKVYDDEWEAIYGKQQLLKFASEQVQNAPDDFMEENDAFYGLDKQTTKNYKKLVVKCESGEVVNDFEFVKWAIEDVRHFEIEEINVY